ncbi:MAG: hypothetical protein ACK5EZ_08640 [Bacteroidota bacterium]|jgi:hypothetical protein|nr:hypothetical protein [Chitinophagaceae bacterium]
MRNKDNYILGLTIGAVLPLLSFFGYYYWKFSLFTFSEFIELLSQNKSLVTALSIPCLLLNIVLFTIFINGRKDKTAKGIFIASIIYALSALLFKFLF